MLRNLGHLVKSLQIIDKPILYTTPVLRVTISSNMSKWSVPISVEARTGAGAGETLSDFNELAMRMKRDDESNKNNLPFINRICSDPLTREDPTKDTEFYEYPRFVTHIDDTAIESLRSFYKSHLKDDSTVIDLCSSWISHLPPEKKFVKVIGIGMNEKELKANKRLDEIYVHDLNDLSQRENLLPMLDTESVDHVICAVSIDYLIQPFVLFQDILRILKPSCGSTFIISFSNRCFPTKAVRSWLKTDDTGRIGIVCSYFEETY